MDNIKNAMLIRLAYRVILFALILTIGLCFTSGNVSAKSTQLITAAISFNQSDTDGDSQPDMATITFVDEGEQYQVVVYDQRHDMLWSKQWEAGTDFVNDVWVFTAEGENNAKLIIRFSQSSEGYTADLFDDVNGDAEVAYQLQNENTVDITESTFPTAHIAAKQPWILPDGAINYLLHITIYRASYEGSLENIFPKDGRPGIETELADQNEDEIVDYELTRYFPDVPLDWAVRRTYLNVNVDGKQPPGFTGYFLWPYLGDARNDILRRPGDLFPPILVDWQKGKIKAIADFLPRWGSEMHWLFNSFFPLKKNEINELAFERFGHYNFSGSPSPDMIIRRSLGEVGLDEIISSGSQKLFTEQAGISWHQNYLGTLIWDYKLEMAGMHAMPKSIVDFKDFAIRDVPYADWPGWLVNQEWAYATFVSTEGHGYETNEQIYEWNTVEGAYTDITDRSTYREAALAGEGQRQYLFGQTDTSPAVYYTKIRKGFRGEYADLNGKAGLYFSPIDRKLHLLKAGQGVWNLDGNREIRYENLGGEVLNKWVLVQDDQDLKNLYQANDFLIYTGESEIRVLSANIDPVLFRVLPPRNRDEWKKLGEELERNKPDFAPDDFKAMIQQFNGLSLTLNKAEMRSFRLTPDGFRFILELQPGFSYRGSDLLPLNNVSEGQYLVRYNGKFSVQPLTPAKISITLRLPDEKEILDLKLIPVKVAVQNTGLEDGEGLTLHGQAESGKTVVDLGQKDANIQSNETVVATFDWQPIKAGDWRLHIWIEDTGGHPLAESSSVINIPPSGSFNDNSLFFLSSGMGRALPSFLALLAFAGVIASIIKYIGREVNQL